MTNWTPIKGSLRGPSKEITGKTRFHYISEEIAWENAKKLAGKYTILDYGKDEIGYYIEFEPIKEG